MKYSEKEVNESRAYLLKVLKPGATVLTVLRTERTAAAMRTPPLSSWPVMHMMTW